MAAMTMDHLSGGRFILGLGVSGPQVVEGWYGEPFAKPLKMNRHSQKCCIAMFGKETDNWIGKRLTLYAKEGTYFGERGTAVRIQGSPDLAAPISVEVRTSLATAKERWKSWCSVTPSVPNSKSSGAPSMAQGFAFGSKPPISKPPTSSL